MVLGDLSLLDLGDQLGEGGLGLALGALGATGDECQSAVSIPGGMREWPNRTVSKTVVGVRPPWVQIPLPPPLAATTTAT